MQRVLWIAFLICLGWTFLGLTAGLPLYLIDTPCVAQSGSQMQLGGQISTLQDLSLLRLLYLLDNRNITTVSVRTQLISRTTINGNDLTSNIRDRLIVLTVLTIVLGVLPLAWKLHKEFNKLLGHRELWLSSKCGGLDLGWLSITSAPGFRGWGEQRFKDFLRNNGLGPSLDGGTSQSNAEHPSPEERQVSTIDVAKVFTIVKTPSLHSLIEERTQILDRLEEAETRYIASFRMTTPEPSIMGELPAPEIIPHISRPRVLAGTIKSIHQRRKRGSVDQSAPLTSFVAPSSYYRLKQPKHHRAREEEKTQNPLGQAIQDRLIGSRFQEVNRNSNLYDPIPLGSALQIGESGNLEPIPEDGTRATFSRWESSAAGGEETHPRSFTQPPTSERESFPMRQVSQDRPPEPPHLRTQTDRPFVRPLSGVDPEGLSLVYDDIRHWRSRLKDINNQVSQAQESAFINISEGTDVTGWLLIGRGLQFLPGIEIIEGRSKSDIRWDHLQGAELEYRQLMFWTTVCFIGLILGAGLIAVTVLALSNAPGVAGILTFLRPLTAASNIGASLVITLVPAILLTIFVITALRFVEGVANRSSSVSVSGAQFSAFKATFYLLALVAGAWVIAVGALAFAMSAFDSGSGRAESVAHGSIYVGALALAILLNAAFISPALLLLRPVHLWRVWRNERAAVTPRQRFRARYPAPYNPTMIIGCSTLAIVFASMFSSIFPLIGPAVVLLLFLTLVAHRYLVGYAYGRSGVGERGGLLQIWLIRRFASIITLQPILLGLIFMSQRLWILGGILTGIGTFLLIGFELYTSGRTRRQASPSGSNKQSLAMFQHIAFRRKQEMEQAGEESSSHQGEQGSITSRARLSQIRSRGSLASVLEMMSITLATMPSRSRNQLPVPLETEDLDDLTATDRAARRHPSAPPHLPPLSFEDRATETAGMLYAPDMLAEPPAVWLPNDWNGIALAEAYDLQRYHDLDVVLDAPV